MSYQLLALALLAWPAITALVTLAWTPLSTAQIAAALGTGEAARYVTMWEHVVYNMAAAGVDSPKVLAGLRFLGRALAEKLGKGDPPSSGPSAMAGSVLAPFPAEQSGSRVQLLPPIAATVVSSLAFLAAFSACSPTFREYEPTPADELGVVSYAGAESACLALDAGKASKEACVHAVRCARGRADAGSCADASADAAPKPIVDCLSDGGVYGCTNDTTCSCRARATSDAGSEGGAR